MSLVNFGRKLQPVIIGFKRVFVIPYVLSWGIDHLTISIYTEKLFVCSILSVVKKGTITLFKLDRMYFYCCYRNAL